MSVSSRTMTPDVTVSNPASNPSSVLLPLPEAPITARNCPCGTENEMPRRISTTLEPLLMLFTTERTSITVRGVGELGSNDIRIDKMRADAAFLHSCKLLFPNPAAGARFHRLCVKKRHCRYYNGTCGNAGKFR